MRHSNSKSRGILVRQQSLSVQALICVLAMVSSIGRPELNPTSAPGGESANPSLQEVQTAIYAAIEQSEYEIGWQPSAGAYMTPNRAQNLRFTFLEDGVRIVPREGDTGLDWSATVRLATIGRAAVNTTTFTPLNWSVAQNTARMVGKEATIEYRNDKGGLRQDFLIAQRPPGEGPLRLEFLVALDKGNPSVTAGNPRRALSNIQHPTPNIEHPTPSASAAALIGCWMFDVGCWMFDSAPSRISRRH